MGIFHVSFKQFLDIFLCVKYPACTTIRLINLHYYLITFHLQFDSYWRKIILKNYISAFLGNLKVEKLPGKHMWNCPYSFQMCVFWEQFVESMPRCLPIEALLVYEKRVYTYSKDNKRVLTTSCHKTLREGDYVNQAAVMWTHNSTKDSFEPVLLNQL